MQQEIAAVTTKLLAAMFHAFEIFVHCLRWIDIF